MTLLGDIEATGSMGSHKLLEMGLLCTTADCRISRDNVVYNGSYSSYYFKAGYLPAWSAGRLLTLLPYTDDFFWSLYKLEDIPEGVFSLSVQGKYSRVFHGDRLINVVIPAMEFALENGCVADAFIYKDKDWGSVFRKAETGAFFLSDDACERLMGLGIKAAADTAAIVEAMYRADADIHELSSDLRYKLDA